jgi:lipoprotein-anchoring transpeptidase ErfK/SrfK
MTTKTDSIHHDDVSDKLIKVRISRKPYKLVLFKRYEPEPGKEFEFLPLKEYSCAHGLPEYPTPKGFFTMLTKAKDPDWRPPDSDWVTADMRDENGVPKLVPGGSPENPIRGAFLNLGNGIGIHGTLKLETLGTRASHGCVRVSEDDAYELYRRVPVGTTVYIY